MFELVEVKELKHQLKLTEKELEIQRSIVADYEAETESLSEEKSRLSEWNHYFAFIINHHLLLYTVTTIAEKDERIHKLQDRCEELEHLEDVELKLQEAEEEIKK